MTQKKATASSWLAQAKALEDGAAEIWKPQRPGDAIAGRIVAVTKKAGEYNDGVIVEIEQEDGKPIAFWLATVLRSLWQEMKPVKGDVIAVKYVGDRVSKRGATYRNFAMGFLERASETAEISDDDGADEGLPV